jgi:hypothetical protein
MVRAVDISNYTGPILADHVAAWRGLGVGVVQVQAIDPPPQYPPGVTAQQLATLRAAGMDAEAYIYLWFDDVSLVRRGLALLQGSSIRRIWLDIEDDAAQKYNPADTEARVQQALDACDTFGAGLGLPQTGIYTGNWFWTDARYMANTQRFSDRLLWDAHYDGIADATQNFAPYGGWTSCAIKQYIGTSELAGVGHLDQSVLHPDYAASLAQQQQQEDEEVAYPVPAQYTRNGWNTWRDVAINLQGIADAMGQQLTTLQAELAKTDADASAKLDRIKAIVDAAPSGPA